MISFSSFIWLLERPSKTATGTIAIQVEDFNDHCPTLTATTHTMCFEDRVIYITAVDKDEFPNSTPFEFSVVEGSSQGKWIVERINGKVCFFSNETLDMLIHSGLFGHLVIIS